MDLYKMIIGDDEQIIRESLLKFIDWKALGFEVVALFEDGNEGIELLKKFNVDVVLCDIMMQEVTGLDVAQYIYENKIDCEIVLISGYQNFEYARTAITYGVKEYLLKPINISNIKKVFKIEKQKLDEKIQYRIQQKARQDTIKEYRHAALLKLIEFCKLGILLSEDSIYNYIQEFGIETQILKSYCYNFMIDASKLSEYDAFLKEIFENIFNLLNKEYDFCEIFVQYTDDNSQYEILLVTNTLLKKDTFLSLISDIKKMIVEICGVEISVLETKKILTFIDFLLAYRQNPSYLDQKSMQNDRNGFIDTIARQFLMILYMTSDFDHISQSIREWFASEKSNTVIQSFEVMQQVQNRMAQLIMEQQNLTQLILVVPLNCDSNMIDNILLMLGHYHEMIHKKTEIISNLSTITQKYVSDHITETISLKEAAEKSFLSSNYFCRLFKEQTGEKYSEYCMRIKMEYAAKMLRESHKKIYEISEYLGYNNIKYFYKIFKRVYQCTPSEYRNQRTNK